MEATDRQGRRAPVWYCAYASREESGGEIYPWWLYQNGVLSACLCAGARRN